MWIIIHPPFHSTVSVNFYDYHWWWFKILYWSWHENRSYMMWSLGRSLYCVITIEMVIRTGKRLDHLNLNTCRASFRYYCLGIFRFFFFTTIQNWMVFYLQLQLQFLCLSVDHLGQTNTNQPWKMDITHLLIWGN